MTLLSEDFKRSASGFGRGDRHSSDSEAINGNWDANSCGDRLYNL
ncbi:MAG: hypothetical protein AB4352_10180 [Hormoscilla sp.]